MRTYLFSSFRWLFAVIVVACSGDDSSGTVPPASTGGSANGGSGAGGVGGSAGKGGAAGLGGAGSSGVGGVGGGPAGCGNAVTEPGEACDGAALVGLTCSSLPGFKSGTLKCKQDCSGYDVSQCLAADTTTAASCEAADVQAAVDQAKDGTTVVIPAGSCTWNKPVIVDATSGSINIQGSGIDSTLIAVAGVSGLAITTTEGHSFVVSNLQFTGGGDNGFLITSGSSKAWRIHDNKFAPNGLPPALLWTYGDTYGVIDHNTAEGSTPSEFVNVNDTDWTSWQRPMTMGTAQAVYIEDNTVSYSGQWEGRPLFDGQRGGRAVVRRNHVTNQMVGSHGFDSGGDSSILQFEIYDNQFTFDDFTHSWASKTWSRFVLIRGGTGVVYNNTFAVATDLWLGGSIGLAVFRNNGSGGSWKVCDGTPRKFCSNIDKTWKVLAGQSPRDCAQDGDCEAGFSCKWKFCSVSKTNLCAQDADCPSNESCSGFIDGPTAQQGYPCLMQPGFGTQMQSMPIYAWNNASSGSQNKPAGSVDAVGEQDALIVAGRDFVNHTPQPGYVPYVYPHPLVTLP